MIIIYAKSFYKDIQEIKNRKLALQLKEVIEEIKNIDNIYKITNIKKMGGYKNYFRKRIGNYRLGMKIENDKITFLRFKHRKDIYKVFP